MVLSFILLTPALSRAKTSVPQASVLSADDFRHFFDAFNQSDLELYREEIPNSLAWDFLQDKMPLFDCPDAELEQIYYFRWWTFRKHIKWTPKGFVITEFLPNVGWAGKYNTISCAAAHHFHEGRWLADSTCLNDYARFWFSNDGNPRLYSFPVADALWSQFLVTGYDQVIRELLPALIVNFEAWEKDHCDANGLYWQSDDRDGMEESISGKLAPRGEGYRVTINSDQYGDAVAIANIAERMGKDDVVNKFRTKAREIRERVVHELWDSHAEFFKVMPRGSTKLSDVRELHGYTPWYFHLPDPAKAVAWKQLQDPKGFRAPYGPTTAERRHAAFSISYQGHECQWNGPSWPFATSVTLTAMANLLNDGNQDIVTSADYLDLLKIYVHSQHRTSDDGQVIPWIDENLNPMTGDWISRTRLKSWKNGDWDSAVGGKERGKDYNHSTFCDLIVSGLIGLRPRPDNLVEVNPLVPVGIWDYFCLDRVHYHGHWLTILFDQSGEHYRKGKGLRLLADGLEIAAAPALGRLVGQLPFSESETTAGWKKYDRNPVIGGRNGTCFDLAVVKERENYRMWLSWRPKQSVALVESRDGIHWSDPPAVALSPRPENGWEDDINRPTVLKRENGYHMWYTGQSHGRSAIGYATSSDGKTWKRMSEQPVLKPDQAWEKVAVMCPHVIWDDTAKAYRMWYSGGEQYEPDAIGYATSADGLKWSKRVENPIFSADPNSPWERQRVTACQVMPHGNEYVMFYIGFRDIDHAQIGLARSKDGISQWKRHPQNPIIRPGLNKWDHDACYKPFAIFDGRQWLVWYNGRRGSLEQIGLVFHDGDDLQFDASVHQ